MLSNEHITLILQIILSLIGTAMVPLLKGVADAQKTKRRQAAVQFLGQLAQTVVLDAMREVHDLQNGHKPGTWDTSAKERLRSRAIAFMKRLGSQELQVVMDAACGGQTVDDFLAKLIEAQVQAVKLGSLPPPPPGVPSSWPPPTNSSER